MKKPILLGVDAALSPSTQYALHTVSTLLEQSVPHVSLVLLTIIPLSHVVAANPGLYAGQIIPVEVTPTQRKQAEEAIQKAHALLQQQGIPAECITGIVRIGVPADEIIRTANELQAGMIVLGSRGDSFRHRLQRLLFGSISHRVLRLASCPVLIVVPPRQPYAVSPKPPGDLVSWYETAITRYLSEHTGTLQVFTPHDVASRFVPPPKKTPQRKEIAAATLALENLARNGILFRHDVKGEMRYVND